MESSSYFQNNYLRSIVQKQDKTRPITIPQLDTPYHFRQKDMTPFQKNQVIQLKILENPDLYTNTHIKCNVCNIYVLIDEVDRHSFMHLEEEERIDRILTEGKL